ncbi:MAG: hypothetical protein ACLSC9_04230 [Barnesiella sp.]
MTQTLNPYSRILPNSPEAASLSKYAEFPVSYFYGLPQIDLPLYEININGFSLPISVNYHGGGIRCEEFSGRVGLGWTLNAGGAITRQVCGLPDETFFGSCSNITPEGDIYVYRGFYHLYPPDKESIRYNMNKSLIYNPGEYNSASAQLNLYKQIRLRYNFEGGYMDSALDRYTFNFMGYSGTFIMPLACKDSVIFQTDSPVEMDYVHFPFKFVMRDKKGTSFIFDERETSFLAYTYLYNPDLAEFGSGVLDSLSYTSAWYLSKIVTASNDTVYFNYSQLPAVNVQMGYYVESISTRNKDIPVNAKIPKGFSSAKRIRYKPVRLDKIVASGSEVCFISDKNPRLDIKNDYTRLDSLIVKSRDGRYVKQYAFSYSYFCNTDVRYDLSQANALKLDGIDEVSSDSKHSQSLYRFDYYKTGNFGSWYRPVSLGQDHWGYNNGTTKGMIPPNPTSDPWFHTSSSGDRSVKKDEAKYGTLTKITYPTGGYTEFNWENNTYSYIGDYKYLLEKSDIEYRIIGDTLCGLPEGEKLQVDIYTTTSNKIQIRLDQYFESLGEFLTPWLSYQYDFPGNNPMLEEPEPDFPSIYVYYLGKEKSEDNKKLVNFYLLNHMIHKFPVEKIIPDEDGYYRIELKYPRGAMNPTTTEHTIYTMFTDYRYYRGARYGHIPVSLMIPTNTSIRETVGLAGGLRIRSISSFAGEGDTIFRTFTYGDPNLSSGVLTDFTDYRFLSEYAITLPPADQFHFSQPYQYQLEHMCSEGLYSTPTGKPRVEYGWVRESFISTDNPETIGNVPGIDYYYTTVRDNIMDYMDMNDSGYGIYQPPANRLRTSKSHWRGNLKRKVYWKRPGSMNDSKEISYDYYIHEDRTDHYFPGGLFRIADYSSGGFAVEIEGYPRTRARSDYGMTKFRIIPYNKMLKEQREITTTSSGAIEETLRYTYPFTGYNKSIQATLPLSKELENSKGEKIVIYYTYYRNTDKVETEVRVENGYITDAVRMQYDDYARITATYSALLPHAGVPAASYPLGTSLKTPAELKTLLNIREYEYLYDSQNNLRDIYYKGDHVASFLWAYNGSHPVAEFKKRNSEEVDSFLREIGTDRGSFLKESSEVKTKLDRIRTLHPDVEMRSMSYHWLVGIASETDARGVTTYYNYDGYGRLSTIKDYNNYLIRKHTYHYKTR